MKTWLACLACLLASPRPAPAQDHLVPESGTFEHPESLSYQLKFAKTFAQAFDEGVVLRSLVRPSFEDDHVVGVRIRDGQAEVFVLEPSSSIARSYQLEACLEEIRAIEEAGEEPPPELIARRDRLRRTAVVPREIRAIRRARPIPPEVADGIRSIWEKMLLEVRHPKGPNGGFDGVDYHFSAFLPRRGEIGGQVWSPDPRSRTGQLTRLADAMADHARGKVDLAGLKATLAAARASIRPEG